VYAATQCNMELPVAENSMLEKEHNFTIAQRLQASETALDYPGEHAGWALSPSP